MKTRQYINTICILCLLSILITPITAQDLSGCPPSEIFDLNSGVVNVGNGEEGCGCSGRISKRDNCRLIGISLMDTIRQTYSCYGVLLNSQNPYIDYFDIYSTRSCREYDPISPELPTRYFLDASNFPPGSVIEVLVCSNDEADMKIDLTATPSGICQENPCSIDLLCPPDRTLKPSADECIYVVGDYRDEVEIIDTCDVMLGEYFIEQYPAPGDLIFEDSEVTFTIYVDSDDSRAYVARCAMDLTIILDTIPPSIFVDDIEQSTIACFESLPALQSFSVDDDNVTVVASINEYEVDLCNGYSLSYKWEASDPCGNTSTVIREYNVLPDLSAPSLEKVPKDIILEVNANCVFFGVIPVIKSTDDCTSNSGVLVKLYDENDNFIRELTKDIKLDNASGYVVYEVSDECGNLRRDTSNIQGVDITEPIFECIENIDYIVSPIASCAVKAEWAIPFVSDNCSGLTLTQIMGPQSGELLESGDYEVVYEAIDNFGNVSQCSFNIFVKQQSIENFNCIGINYSVDQSCSSDLLYEAIFEHNGISCTEKFNITLITKGGIKILDEYLTDYIGETVNYEICYEDQTNCCVAEITIEDKLPPTIICADQVLNCWEDFDTYAPQVTNECKPVTWEITEEIIPTNCNNPSAGRIMSRQYIAVDISGNRSLPCIQEISINAISLDDLITTNRLQDAVDTTFSCDQYDDFIKGTITVDGPIFNGAPLNRTIDSIECEMKLTYEDQTITNIQCEKKILRKWTVSSSKCSKVYETTEFTQFISFRDTIAPVISVLPTNITYTTNQGSCEAWVPLPEPTISDNCSQSEDLSINIIGEYGMVYDKGVGLNLTVGEHMIIYEAMDDCSNSSYDTLIIDIVDRSAPVAICLEFTTVSLSQGKAWLYGRELNLSSYDDCDDIDSFLVRRMDVACSDLDTVYAESVSFCCVDVDQSIPIMLRVKDHSNNWNECMVIVDVQDKSVPTITCLPDITLDCRASELFSDELSYADLLGSYVQSIDDRAAFKISPEYIIDSSGELLDGVIDGYCEGLITSNIITKEINNCGIGTVQRSFEIRRQNGDLLRTCIQNIYFLSSKDKEEYLIDWPDSLVSTEGCLDEDQISDRIFGQPVLQEQLVCTLFGTSYSDEHYSVDTTNLDKLCYKIKRTWQVIDWCDQDDAYLSTLEFVQWIYVYESSPTSQLRNIFGHVTEASGAVMFDVRLELADMTAEADYVSYTDLNGEYQFDRMSTASSFELSPSYTDEAIKGVSSFDLLLLQKHILGIESLDDHNKLIAADVNKDGMISSLDLIQMRSLILGQTVEWPNNESWRFYQSSLDFSIIDPLSHLVVGRVDINEENLIDKLDFTAIKVGDVSSTTSTEKSMKSSASVERSMAVQDQLLKKGNQYDIIIPLSELDFTAIQLNIIAKDGALRFLESEQNREGFYTSAIDGQLKVIGTVPHTVSVDEILVRVEAYQDILLSEAIGLDTEFTKIWTSDMDVYSGLKLQFLSKKESQRLFSVSANQPNPFFDNTTIPITLYHGGAINISIRDAYGSIRHNETMVLDSGDHSINISGDQFKESGIYYLTISSLGQSDTQKIVFIQE